MRQREHAIDGDEAPDEAVAHTAHDRGERDEGCDGVVHEMPADDRYERASVTPEGDDARDVESEEFGAEVWGVVYRLHDRDLAALDRREGYDPGKPSHVNRYNRQTVRVRMDARELECLTYFARPEPGEHVPSADYLRTIIEGAEENGLPVGYVAALKRITTV